MDDFVIFDWDLFRRDVRRDVRNCVLFVLFFYGVMLLAAGIVQGAYVASDPAILEAAASLDLDELTEAMLGAGDGVMVGLMSIIGIAAGGCVFFIMRKGRYITDLAMPVVEPITPKIFFVLVAATQGIQLVYSLLITLVDMILPEGLSLEESYAEAMESLITPVGILYIVLIGPIFEELIFRGAIMGSLRKYGDNFAILFSSIIFGFYHAVLLQIPFGFVMGLLFGYACARWSLRASIALHIAVNGLSVLFSDTDNEYLMGAGVIFMIACGAIVLVMAIRQRDVLRARVQSGAAYYPGTYANGFSSIAFWIFLAVMGAFGAAQMAGVF